MKLYEKLFLGWFWFIVCYEEWRWLMTHNESSHQFFQDLNFDIVKVVDTYD